jgi:hypothetical protein
MASMSDRGISAFWRSSTSASGRTVSDAKARASAWSAARAAECHGEASSGGFGAIGSGLAAFVIMVSPEIQSPPQVWLSWKHALTKWFPRPSSNNHRSGAY